MIFADAFDAFFFLPPAAKASKALVPSATPALVAAAFLRNHDGWCGP
jgi:hypothetical protein